MSPPHLAQPADDRTTLAIARFAAQFGIQIRDERPRRRLTMRQLGERAGVSPSEVFRVESGRVASVHAYVRLSVALGLRPEVHLEDPRRQTPPRSQDAVHGAMGEVEAVHLRPFAFPVGLDEPFQHYQFAGRADLVAIDVVTRSLLHIENRTQFPNLQDAAGSYNAKRAYLAPILAQRHGVPGGFANVTHAVVALWSAEVLHTLRLRTATFRAMCPDPLDAFEAWWSGTPARGTQSTFALFDPLATGRARRFVGLDAALKVDPRYRGYADALDALRRNGLA